MKWIWAVGVAILATGSLHEPESKITFSTPSFVEEATIENVDWIAYAANSTLDNCLLLEGGPGKWQRFASFIVDHDNGEVDLGAANVLDVIMEERSFDHIELEAYGNGLHGLSMQAGAIQAITEELELPTVVARDASLQSSEFHGGSMMDWQYVPSHDSLVFSTELLATVAASTDLYVSLAGWKGTATIDGDSVEIEDRAVVRPDDLVFVYYVYRIQMDAGDVDFNSSGQAPTHSLMIAQAPHLSARGQIMLPNVQERPAGAGEFLPNGTLLLEGPARFDRMVVDDLEASRIRSDLSGEFRVVRIDGRALDAEIALPAALAAGAVAAIVLGGRGLLGLALFTRLSPQEALEHPRRQSLHRYIQEHPGATFRELCRATDIPAGTCRHHLSVLDRAQVIVEHRHRATVRFFENHGKFDHKWQEVVMLREPELAKIHGWLGEQEGVIQKDILEHALSSWGWSRSTTQHRLQRLVDNGLVDVQEMGRRKSYSLASDEPEPVRQFGLRV